MTCPSFADENRPVDLTQDRTIIYADLTAPIPLYDIAQPAQSLLESDCDALRRVIRSGRFAAGPELAAFEQEFAAYLDAARALGVKSGTDALILSLDALGIGPGDEVVTTPFTFFATAEAILRVGATPVFADITLDTLCLDPAACADAVTSKTRALLFVHVFGHCPDLSPFVKLCARHNLAFVEDASQAAGSTWQGRKLGTIGILGTFSFYPTKNLAALGDGGAIATNDSTLCRTIYGLRMHGRDENGRHPRAGYNSRLDEVQAAFLRSRLRSLDQDNLRRRVIAQRYDIELHSLVRLVRGTNDCISNYHQYAVLTAERNRLRRFLSDNGVETGCYYETPVHFEPVFNGLRHRLPRAEQACREVINLPIRSNLTDEDQDRVISLIRRFYIST